MEQLDGRTKYTAIFGDPVEHSLSPAMHNAAYAALGLNRAYLAFHVSPNRLRDGLRALVALRVLGVNLTVPHKEAALPLMDNLSDEAKLLGAVNCVINRDGKLIGDNTDARGLERDLREAAIDLARKHAIVIGAGGAAASAIVAAARIGAERITICNRTIARAVQIADRLRPACRDVTIESCSLEALSDGAAVRAAAIVMNATPLGLKAGALPAINYAATSAGCVFYDLVYAREPTPFLQGAGTADRRALDGAGMLIGQGELAFALFNGIAPPQGIMRRALMQALSRT